MGIIADPLGYSEHIFRDDSRLVLHGNVRSA